MSELTDQPGLSTDLPGRVLRARVAAEMIGLSVAVLMALKKSGVYQVNSLVISRPGFHELDVEQFRKRLLALPREANFSSQPHCKTISLKRALDGRHDSPGAKAEIIGALISGKLQAVGHPDALASELMLGHREYRKFMARIRIRHGQETRPSTTVVDSSTPEEPTA